MKNRTKYPLKNTFGKIFECEIISTEEQNHQLAILFPGAGYNTKMPLLYYSNSLLVEKGYDVLHLNYNLNGRSITNYQTSSILIV